jgi:hypothetical protein
MSHGLFTDKTWRPSVESIEEALGLSLPLWHELGTYLRTNFRTKEELVFLYGKEYGWALRFQISGKLLCALFPNADYFVTLMVMSQAHLKLIEGIKLHQKVKSAIQSANPYREGKWLFIRSETGEDMEDLQLLLQMKYATSKGHGSGAKRSG